MTTPLAAIAQLTAETKEKLFASILDIARFVGLDVDSWRVGDPTRTLYRALAEKLETVDAVQANYAAASFLDTASGDFLALRASDVYNVPVQQATFATPTVSFRNIGGGLFVLEPGSLTVSASTTKATFINQNQIRIDPGSSGSPFNLADAAFVAQVAGSSGSVVINEIDTVVTPPMPGVTITGASSAVGADAQSDPSVREACRGSLGALSPNGPFDAYEYVALNPDLTGVQGLSRAKAVGDSGDGTVTVYIAFAGSSPDGAVVAAVQAAEDVWAQPLCTDATVVAGVPRTVNYSLDVTPNLPDALATVQAGIDAYHAQVKFGGVLARSAVASILHEKFGAQVVSVTPVLINSADADLTLAANEFPVRGTVTLL